MSPWVVLAGCLTALVLLGLTERFVIGRARRAVPIRVHVNGTRGKSTVTRLIAAALREAGVPAVAKVTGTSPSLILPDGTERPVRRRGPANVREQAWAVRQAHRHAARALVVECMAVRPDLQWTAERDMVRATIGVITNVRHDHGEVMGRTLEDVARSLANTTPAQATLVVGDPRFLPVFEDRARASRTRVVLAGPVHRPVVPGGPDDLPGWWRENVTLALAVTRELGIPDDVAQAGMRRAAPDPGSAATGRLRIAGSLRRWLDATAANDPESLDQLARDACLARPGNLLVYNHRGDRPIRLDEFVRGSATVAEAAQLLVTGDCPALVQRRRVQRQLPGRVQFVARAALAGWLAGPWDARPGPAGGEEEPAGIIFCGNTRGFSVSQLLGALGPADEERPRVLPRTRS